MPRRAALTRKRARPPCAPWELIPIASNPVFPQYRADPLYCSQRGVSVHVRKTGAVQLGVPVGRLLPHRGTVRRVVFNNDGSGLLTADDGGDEFTGAAAGLWYLSRGPRIRHLPLKGSETAASVLAFARDGRSLFIGFT